MGLSVKVPAEGSEHPTNRFGYPAAISRGLHQINPHGIRRI